MYSFHLLYCLDGPIPLDVDPVVQDLPPVASSKPPHFTTSIFSTSAADFRLIPSVGLLSILILNILDHQALGPYPSN